MVEVYFYLPIMNVDNAVTCGIKLSDWFSKEVELDGDTKKCISALLNPRDDIDKYISHEYKCIKMEIMPKYCYVADGALYRTGLNNEDVMEMYVRSIIPIERYNFGKFRFPECLVTCTVLGDFVKVLDKRLDSPILFNNSEELYMGNIIESFKENHENFNDALLYSFFSRLADMGKIKKIEDIKNGMAIYTDTCSDAVYTINIPDYERF